MLAPHLPTGSPLGAFIDGVPSTPLGPVNANTLGSHRSASTAVKGAGAGSSLAAAVVAAAAGAGGDEDDVEAVGKALEGLPEAKLAGLQSFISRLIGRGAAGGAPVA